MYFKTIILSLLVLQVVTLNYLLIESFDEIGDLFKLLFIALDVFCLIIVYYIMKMIIHIRKM